MSTALSPQEILDFDHSIISIEPNYAFLGTFGSFSLLGAFSPSLANVVADLVAGISDISGTVTIVDGLLSSDLNLPDGSLLEGELNIPETLATFADLAADTSGLAELADGIFSAEITTGDQSLIIDGFDVAAFTSDLVLETINGINTSVPFEKGAFTFTEETSLGSISGSVDLGGGDLNLDLLTPFGDIVADIDFGEGAVVPFVVPTSIGNIEAAIDFNAGDVVAFIDAIGNIAVPIAEISGEVALADGIATFSTDLPFVGTVETELEIGPLASEYVAGFLQDLGATATITDGLIEANLESAFGNLATIFDAVAFTNDGADFFSQVSGDLTFENGNLLVTLSTPLGDVDNVFDLGAVAGLLDVPLGDIF
jgi:hypothetical protein